MSDTTLPVWTVLPNPTWRLGLASLCTSAWPPEHLLHRDLIKLLGQVSPWTGHSSHCGIKIHGGPDTFLVLSKTNLAMAVWLLLLKRSPEKLGVDNPPPKCANTFCLFWISGLGKKYSPLQFENAAFQHSEQQLPQLRVPLHLFFFFFSCTAQSICKTSLVRWSLLVPYVQKEALCAKEHGLFAFACLFCKVDTVGPNLFAGHDALTITIPNTALGAELFWRTHNVNT